MEIEIRPPDGVVLDAELAAAITERLGALARFAGSIRQIVVRLSDMEKPPGTQDKMCYLTVCLLPRGEVMNLSVGPDYYAALCLAVNRIAGAIARELAQPTEP